ncbi:DUF397 domain-containing protein [Streptomyces sp. SS8]
MPVRDSKTPEGPAPVLPDVGRSALVTAVKGGMI